MLKFDKLELSRMTWREIFDTIQDNFEKVYNMILDNSVEVYIEQFAGGKTVYNLEHIVDKSTTLLVFRGNQFLGGKEGSAEYTVGSDTITFSTKVEEDDTVTVQFMQANALGNVSQEYVNQIKEMYDALEDLNIDATGLVEEANSLKDMLLQWGNQTASDFRELKAQVQNIQTRAEATKDYIEELMQGQELGEASVEAEVVAARRGYSILGERLDNMPFKVQSVEEMKHNINLREGDVVLVGENDYIVAYKIEVEYEGPIKNITIDNGLKAVKASSSIQVGDTPDEELEFEEERPVVVKVGEESKPVVLSELLYGYYFVQGYYKIYPYGQVFQVDTPVNVQVAWSNADGYKVRTITVSSKLFIVKIKGLQSMMTEITEMGETMIGHIADGTVTGAISSMFSDIINIKKKLGLI